MPPQVLDRVRIPRSFSPRSANSRRELAALLRTRTDGHGHRRGPGGARGAHDEDAELAQLRAQMRAHPCHGCADREQHARWAERAQRLRTETAGLQRRLEGADQLHRPAVRPHLRACSWSCGYLTGPVDTPKVTDAGKQLSRIYGESDLLAMQCLRTGLWDALSAAELAAACSALVYESRGSSEPGAAPPRVPGAIHSTLDETMQSGEPSRSWSGATGCRPPASRTSGSRGRSTGGPRGGRCARSSTARS